jgi:hypothetical protein
MADDLSATLAAWQATPTSETAIELCRAIAAGVADSVGHRARLAEVGPLLIASHAADGEVMLALGALYLRGGELFLADAVLKRVLAATPDDPRVWRLLGEVFLRAGNARDAVTAFDGAAARGMTDAATAAWRERSQSYVAMQDAQGSNAVAASIAGATVAAAPAAQPQPAAPTPAAGAPAAAASMSAGIAAQPESARTAVLYVPDHGPADASPDSARTLVIPAGAPAGRGQPLHAAPPAAPVPAAVAAPSHDTARAQVPTSAPPTPHTPRMTGGGAQAAQHAVASGNGGGAREQVSMRGAVSDGRDILDEISMSIHILRLDKAGLPQSERDMDRYLERLRASQGLVIDEPTRVDDRGQAGPTPVDGVPTFQPVTGASTLPMTSVRDVLRELEQAGPASAPSAPGMAAPPAPLPARPAPSGGALPKVVVQAPPSPQAAPPPAVFAPPAAGFAPHGGMAMQPMQQPAAPGPPMVLASRRPPKKTSGVVIVVVLVAVLAVAAGGVILYLKLGAQLLG